MMHGCISWPCHGLVTLFMRCDGAGDSLSNLEVPTRADVKAGASKAGAAVARQASKHPIMQPSTPF